MSMLDATERSRPIMGYVHDLETRIRAYQSRDHQFRVRWFVFGFLAGAAAGSILALLR